MLRINRQYLYIVSYEANVTKIPTAAVTIEDAEMMGRMTAR